MINSNKTEKIRLLGEVDISALRERVSLLSEEFWNTQDKGKPNKFDALDKTEHIVFRFITSFQSHKNYTDFPIWEDWKADIQGLLEITRNFYNYKEAIYSRIMLAKLPAGEAIKPHIDRSPAAEFPHKIHIPIITNEKAVFMVKNESVNMCEGCIYEVNNRVIHSASNNGDKERIHLIFELSEAI